MSPKPTLTELLKTTNGQRFMGVDYVAMTWGISQKTVRNMISEGRCPIPVRRFGRAVRFDVLDIHDAI